MTVSEITPAGESSTTQDALSEVNKWSCANVMSLNSKKCKEFTVSFLRLIVSPPALTINNVERDKVESHKRFWVLSFKTI